MFQLHTYIPSGPILETVIAGDCRLLDGLLDTSIITPSSKYLIMHGLIICQILKRSIDEMKMILRILLVNNIAIYF